MSTTSTNYSTMVFLVSNRFFLNFYFKFIFILIKLERNRYLTMRAQQDTTYANQLNDYNKKNKENEDRNNELRRRYDELINDEQYKATNCRLCPSCKRVVQRLEGCDSMICGQDAHGGNVQSGCGD